MNLFICIEGVDFVGKTTVAKALACLIGGVYYKSPGGVYAQKREIVDENIQPLLRYLFYREAVQYDSEEITKLLKTSSVVCDRYIYSTFAFHAAMDESLQRLFECNGLLMPDYVFLLTADEKERRKRLGSRPAVSGLDRNFPIQRKADELFRLQGHIVVDTTNTTVDEAARIIMSKIRGGCYA